MSVTLANAQGHLLRNPNNNSWNEEGKYAGNPVVPWTFADKNYTGNVVAGTLKKAWDKLVDFGIDPASLSVVSVEGEPKKKKGDKPTPKPEPVEEIEEFEEEDEWALFKKHGLNKKCMECTRNDTCGVPACCELIRCPQYKKKAA